jgi:hypothetical protein
MADAAAGSSWVTLTPAVLTFSAALLAPIIATVASLLARSRLKRQEEQIDYRIKKLELIDKVLTVGKSLSNFLHEKIDASTTEIEYFKIVASLPEDEPISNNVIFGNARFTNALRIPPPQSFAEFIVMWVYYLYLLVFAYGVFLSAFIGLDLLLRVFIPVYHPPLIFSPRLYVIILITPLPSLVIAALARHWAIQTARLRIRREKLKKQQDTLLAELRRTGMLPPETGQRET